MRLARSVFFAQIMNLIISDDDLSRSPLFVLLFAVARVLVWSFLAALGSPRMGRGVRGFRAMSIPRAALRWLLRSGGEGAAACE